MRAKLLAVRRNLGWLVGVRLMLVSTALIGPMLLLRLQSRGFDLRELFILEALFAVALMLFRVPAGMLVDRFGAKISMVAAGVVFPLGHWLYGASITLGHFIGAEMLLALAISLLVACDESTMVESVSTLRRSHKLIRTVSLLTLVGYIGICVGNVVSGLLGEYSLSLPFNVAACITCALPLLALCIAEPRLDLQRNRQQKFNCLSNLPKAIKLIARHPELRWLILCPGLLMATMLAAGPLASKHLIDPKIGAAALGLTMALQSGIAGLVVLSAQRIERVLGKKRLRLPLAVLSSGGFLLLAILPAGWAVVCLMLHAVVRGYLSTVVPTYFAQAIGRTDGKATVLAVRGTVELVIYLIMLLTLAVLADANNVRMIFATLGVLLGLSLWVAKPPQT